MNNQSQRAANRRYKTSPKGRRARRMREMYDEREQSSTKRSTTRVELDRITRESHAKLIRSKKEGIPCTDCARVFPFYCMDFDHRDQSEKKFPLSKMVMCSVENILAEIAKCDLVCANCHRIRTFTRGQHLRTNTPPQQPNQLSLLDLTHQDPHAD